MIPTLTFFAITAFVFWLITLGAKADYEIEEIFNNENDQERHS